ncbi:hypothetical protein TNCT_563281, partial [Trichonephila clavata]
CSGAPSAKISMVEKILDYSAIDTIYRSSPIYEPTVSISTRLLQSVDISHLHQFEQWCHIFRPLHEFLQEHLQEKEAGVRKQNHEMPDDGK